MSAQSSTSASASPLRVQAQALLRPLPPSTVTSASQSPSQLPFNAPFDRDREIQRNLASSSASSSQIVSNTAYGRSDQVIHRWYIKTVQVLVEGRLTHYGGLSKSRMEKKQDKWFNLVMPEVDLHRDDLSIYRSVSSYQPHPQSGPLPSIDGCYIPPLLIAFVLDTTDIPNGQTLTWNRNGLKIPIDTGLLHSKGNKGKEKEGRTGIVLERWAMRATTPPTDGPSSSQLAAHTAYRLGIVHFRAVHSLVRLLPAYRLHRRLRRANNGLRVGIKLWGPEGYPNSPDGIAEAWEELEGGMVPLPVGLDELVEGSGAVDADDTERYDFPKLDLFGTEYALSVDYRPEVDFTVEDKEAVLSEKFVDMDEDWFTPTVARRRSEDAIAMDQTRTQHNVHQSRPALVPANTSPIPQRQQPLQMGSLSSSRPSGSRVTSGTVIGSAKSRSNVGSLGTDKWGALAGGMPFAEGPSSVQTEGRSQDSPSPAQPSASPAAIIAARRLSGHSIQPFTSTSPSTSLLRSTPPPQQGGAPIPTAPRPVMVGSRQSSIGRTSSFLSQSGRSFTHAQIANMYAGSASPPITGAMSGVHLPTTSPPPDQSPVSPSSLSFTKQPVPRSITGRPMYMMSAGSSPFIPGSLEREPSSLPSPNSGGPAPQIIKRYSSSLSQRQSKPGGPGSPIGPAGSQGSSGDGSSAPGSAGQSLLRRISTKESGLRHSLEGPSSRIVAPDEDDIQAFLKTLDTLPQPPSIAAHAIHASRSHLPSGSSSLSVPSVPASPSPLHTSSGSPGAAHNGRVPLTRAEVDSELRRMAGSFSLEEKADIASPLRSQPSTRGSSGRASASASAVPMSTNPSSIGLLSASRPASSPRRVPEVETPPSRPGYRRQTSGEPSPLGPGHKPLQSPTQVIATAGASAMQQLKSADEIGGHSSKTLHSTTARSLPGSGTPHFDQAGPLRSAGPAYGGSAGVSINTTGAPSISTGILSPQTTGGTSTTDSTRISSSRRGPVLLRGGFGDRTNVSGTTRSSPSHSPNREIVRTGVGLGIKDSPNVGMSSVPIQVGSMPPIPSRGEYTEQERERERDSNVGQAQGWRYTPNYTSTIGRRQSAHAGSGYIQPLPQQQPLLAPQIQTQTQPQGSRLKGQRTAPSSLGREIDNEPVGGGAAPDGDLRGRSGERG